LSARIFSQRQDAVAEVEGGAVLLYFLGCEHPRDFGGRRTYIQSQAARGGIEAADACGRMLDRTCEPARFPFDPRIQP
jgi:hypothetical protein